jgi:hypothetical protein
MKTSKQLMMMITVVSLISLLASISSCGPSGGGSETPDMAALLKSGTWKVKTAKVDGTDQISLFTGLSITFAASSFTASNGDPVWPASGTWTLNATTKTITRGDGLVVTVGDGISETALTLTLDWDETTLGGGRVGSIAGQHVFTFGK